MTENKRYDVIYEKEPRGQVVTYEGIPCTARTCCTRLNRLEEENEQLKCEVYSYKCSTETDKEIIEDLHKEYKVLEKKHKELQFQFNLLREQSNEFHRGARENANHVEQLEKENKELKERNNRQCKQLDDLYRLIEEKDWRALTDILDDFKKADEQLQKEWKCYE